ncbi:MAG: hypothetical protein M0R50_11760 [Candidatus Cloacimonetes bacterium]|jgi:hypothetical protein|nr:hypothetical protein [Candidatus Cloacimonadota bacterium]
MGSTVWSNTSPDNAKKELLTLSDTMESAVVKMSKGNPGALNVCVSILKQGEEIDPQGMGGLGVLLYLDSLGIHGSNIWLLFKDVCHQNLVMMMAVLRGYQLGIVRENDILKAIENADSGNRGNNLDLPKILNDVRVSLGTFGGEGPTPTPSPMIEGDRIINL